MAEKSHTDMLADEMHLAIQKYLAEFGWDILVIGSSQIINRPLKYNFTLQFDITAKKDDDDPNS